MHVVLPMFVSDTVPWLMSLRANILSACPSVHVCTVPQDLYIFPDFPYPPEQKPKAEYPTGGEVRCMNALHCQCIAPRLQHSVHCPRSCTTVAKNTSAPDTVLYQMMTGRCRPISRRMLVTSSSTSTLSCSASSCSYGALLPVDGPSCIMT